MSSERPQERERSKGGKPILLHGYISAMADAYLARRCASSFVERCNSAAKLALGEHRPSMNDAELRALCMLRVNRRFIHALHALPLLLSTPTPKRWLLLSGELQPAGAHRDTNAHSYMCCV